MAERLGVLPSRLVILIDEMVEKGWIERRRSQKDRRYSELALTKTGGQMLERVSKLAAEHEADLCAALTSESEARSLRCAGKLSSSKG